MARLHLGVPLQIPDGLLITHRPHVRLIGGTSWKDDLDTWLHDPQGAVQVLLNHLDVTSGDNWQGRSAGDAVVGTVGDLVELPGLGDFWQNELVPRFIERLGVAIDVVTNLPIYIEVPSPMRWIRTQIDATLAGVENLTHVINWQQDGPVGSARNVPELDQAALSSFADAVWTAWVASFSTDQHDMFRATQFFSTALQYRGVKAAVINQDGAGSKPHQVGDSVNREYPALSGTGTVKTLPFEVSACATLRTVRAQTGGGNRGRSNRGRLYFGGLNVDVMSSSSPGLFENTYVNVLADRLGRFFDAVHTATDRHATVVSQAKGYATPITMVQMGLVPDSQRRRRRSQTENYANIWSGQLDTVTVA